MVAPSTPFQPYASQHQDVQGPGDARPTAMKVVEDCGVIGKLKEKTVLITGCSSGIGVDTASALYETGARLFLTARDLPKLNTVIDGIIAHAKYNKDGQRPQAIEMNLDSLESVRHAVGEIRVKCGGELNILICNAGVMACPYGQTKDGFETHFGVNHIAHFLLFQLLKPLLLESAKHSGTTSRLINVSSAGHVWSDVHFRDINWSKYPVTYNKWQAYGSSKTANIYMASSVARRYGAQNLLGWSVHPGGISTKLGRHLTPEDYAGFGDLEALLKTYKSPEQGAATTVWAAVSPHFEGQNGGRYLADCGESGPRRDEDLASGSGYAEHVYDEQAEDKLWKISCEALGVSEAE